MTTQNKHHERVDPPVEARTPAVESLDGKRERSRNTAPVMSAKTRISSSPEQIRIGRVSTGMERTTFTPSTRRLGRFSDGQALPLTASADQFGSFADGQAARPDAAARPRVGSFGDRYDAAATSRLSRNPGVRADRRRRRTTGDALIE